MSGEDPGADGSTPPAAGSARNEDRTAPSTDRALRALLSSLQRPFKQVKPELKRQSVVQSLRRHFVQVVDDQGYLVGSGFPKHRLIYSQAQDRLVLESGLKK